MTTGQWRVLAVLTLTLALEAGFSPTVSSFLSGKTKFYQRGGGTWTADLTSEGKTALVWALGAFVLIALAGKYDGIATWIAVITFTGVMLSHGDKIVPFMQQLQIYINPSSVLGKTQAGAK